MFNSTIGRRNLLIGTTVAVLVLPACKRSRQAAEPEAPAPYLAMPALHNGTTAPAEDDMERALRVHYGTDTAKLEEARTAMHALDAEMDAAKRLEAINQQTMVRPAPADFKPSEREREIRLSISLEKRTIRPGEPLRYHLELTNVGRSTITYLEGRPSIFKYGSLSNSDTIAFYVMEPDGQKLKLEPAPSSVKAKTKRTRTSQFEFLPECLGQFRFPKPTLVRSRRGELRDRRGLARALRGKRPPVAACGSDQPFRVRVFRGLRRRPAAGADTGRLAPAHSLVLDGLRRRRGASCGPSRRSLFGDRAMSRAPTTARQLTDGSLVCYERKESR